MGEEKNAYRVLLGKPRGQRPVGRPGLTWENNIKVNSKVIRVKLRKST
jgi:hypothetical protein